MKTKLFIYALPLLLLAMLLYGYKIQDHPANIDQSPTNENLQATTDNAPVILGSSNASNSNLTACSYDWISQTSAVTTSTLLTVSAVSSKVGWAAGNAVAGRATIVRTIDGTTWTNANTGVPAGTFVPASVFNIYALSANVAYVTTSPGATFIYRTLNGGATWTQVYTDAGFIDAIQMVSPSEGYALGDPVDGRWVVLQTLDGGATWNRLPAAEPVAGATEAGWNNSMLIVGSEMWFGTNISGVYHGPTTGAKVLGPTVGTLNTFAVHYNNALDGLAGGSGTPVLQKSNDHGTTYTGVTAPGTAGNLDGLEGHGTDWWALRSDANIYKSQNQGTTWTTDHTQTGAVYQDIDLTTDGDCAVGWAVGNGGHISKLIPDPLAQIKRLKLFVCIEGYLSCPPNTYIGDTVTVCIRATTPGFPIVAIAEGKSDSLGNVTVIFKEPISNTDSYYIVVKSRNSIETWSKSGGEVWGASTTLNYDFTTAAPQAFGSNMVFKCGKWCIYSGDVNQDGVVDGTDLSLIDNDAANFVQGYVPTDLNCDGIVDGSDAAIADNNASNFVTKVTP